MPNIASVFKAEITRLARKELRSETETLKKTVASQRSELTNLKRRVQTLEATLKRLSKVAAADGTMSRRRLVATERASDSSSTRRFTAKGMATNRQRLGLSAADFGLLVGATGQSVYAWESGKVQPRPDALVAIASLRGVGKREALAKLAELRG